MQQFINNFDDKSIRTKAQKSKLCHHKEDPVAVSWLRTKTKTSLMSLNTIRTGFYNNSDGAKPTLLCRKEHQWIMFFFCFQSDFLLFFDLFCLFDDTWPLTSVFLATFSRCKEDNRNRRHHNITSLVINYNNKISYKENNKQYIANIMVLRLNQFPLDVGGQMDRWGRHDLLHYR